MAFPQTILDLQADLYINGAWTSISTYLYSERQKPTITRGRANESGTASASSFSTQLDNRDNRFSSHNPTGTYYPYLGRNTPLRVHVPDGGTYLRLEADGTSNCSTPTAAALNVAGDLEIRLDCDLADWTSTHLVSKWSNTAGNFSWAFLLNPDGTLSFWYSTDGTTIRKVTSTVPLPWPGGRISLKVTYASATGIVFFRYNTAITGTFTVLGSSVTGAGSGALFAGNASIKIGGLSTYFSGLTGTIGSLGDASGTSFSPNAYGDAAGKFYEFRMFAGINTTVVANPVFTAVVAGGPGGTFVDAQGNTWSVNGAAEITSRKFRFHGEVGEWPPLWDASNKDVYSSIQANGLLRRLQQRNPPVSSAMARGWKRITGIYAPAAYWPCEDGNGPTGVTTSAVSAQPSQIASGLPNVKPMTLTGKQTSFATNTSFLSSNALPVPNKGTWTGLVPAYQLPASGPANVVRLLLSIPATGETDGVTLVRVLTRGTVTQLDLNYWAVGALQLVGYSETGATLFDTGHVTFAQNGVPCLAEMALTVSGGTVTGHVNTLAVGATVQGGFTSTCAGSLGVVTQVIVAPSSANVASAIGHISVQSSYANMDRGSADSLIGPLNAWASETAALRFTRLCAEQGYASRIVGYPANSVIMGPQGIDSFISLIQECEKADHGMIFEPRTALALGYRTSGALSNQDQGISGELPLALDYSAAMLGGGNGMPMTPVDDDMLTINDETVSRGSSTFTGSSAEVAMADASYAATAALSNLAPPNGVGAYQDTRTVNVWNDWQLADQAGWIVHLGTVAELRYTAIPVDLARSQLSALSNALQDLDLGEYLKVVSPPAFLSPDAIKAIVWGTTEVLGGYIYTISFQTQPESPYEVLVAGTGATTDCRADSDASTVSTGFNTTATSLLIATASGSPLWTTVAGDCPVDIVIAGERMTVTAISGATSPQTFTVTRHVNSVVKSHLVGESVTLFQPCYLALA